MVKDVNGYLQEFLSTYQLCKQQRSCEDGCMLIGCIDLYEATGEACYRDFVIDALAQRVAPDGSILCPDADERNLGAVNCGKALFFALKETGDARYRQAIERHMERMRARPRCTCGSFRYGEADGLYMTQPFCMAYEVAFGGLAHLADITRQFENAHRCLYHTENGLSSHACNSLQIQQGTSREAGCSANLRLRAKGCYLMALIDCMGLLGRDRLFEHYKALEDGFRAGIRDILRYQDAATGLFDQMIDHRERPDNGLESSCSAMVAYALMKGVRLGALDEEKYLPLGVRAYEGLRECKLLPDAGGHLRLTDRCSSPFGPDAACVFDGGVGAGVFMMAHAEYLRSGWTD